MKIAMVMSVYGQHAKGGAERSAATAAHYLTLRGHQVSIIALGGSDSDMSPQINENGVSIYHIPLAQIYDPYGLNGNTFKSSHHSGLKKAIWHLIDVYNPMMGWRFRQILKNFKPDIFITHTLQGFSVSVWREIRKTEAKLIHVVNDHALICPPTAMTRGSRVCEKVCTSCSVYSRLRHALAVQPDAIVGPSQIVLDRHRRFGWFEKIQTQVVIPNALPANWPEAGLLQAAKTPIRFGFLGRLDESKGIDLLLQALSYLTNYSLVLYVAGAGDMALARERWLPSVHPLHQVKFLGPVNAAEFLNSIDVLVTPSRANETFCNVVMEAASFGKPAIVSNKGALPERVYQGKTGWIVDECTPLAFAEKMQFVIEHSIEITEKGEKALATRPQYSPMQQAALFEKLCMELLHVNLSLKA
jgi:glycosyltransferase involved in cell wall biosynthesis